MTLVEKLRDRAEGLECGAKCENAIVAAFQSELDAFSARTGDGKTHDIRLIRAVLDARSNARRFTKDAEEIRAAIVIIEVASVTE